MRHWREPGPALSAAAARIIRAVEEEPRLDELVRCVLEQVIAALGADAVALFALNHVYNRLVLLKQRGFPAQFDREWAHLALDAQTIIGKAVASGRVQMADPTRPARGTAAGKEAAPYADFRALIAAPLLARSQMVGVLVIATRQPGQFGASDQPTIEIVAHTIAAAILNARAFESERRTLAALEAMDEATLAISAELEPTRVLQAIVDRAREVTRARYAALGIGTDPDKQFDPWVFSGLSEEHARKIGHYPRPRGLLGAVPAEDQAIRVPDMSRDPRRCGFPPHHPPMKSFVGVPVRATGESIGNLYLADKIGEDEFSAEDQRAAASLAAHAAIAIQHARLYEQAQQERTRLRAVLEGSPLGIVFVEGASGYVYANPAAEELFGRPFVPSSGRAQYVAGVSRPDGSPLSPHDLPSERALRGEAVIGVELVLQRPDGREVPVLANAAPIEDARGQISGAVVIWQDITPLKLEQLREEFISMVAHELRSPIAVIAGHAQLLGYGQHGEGVLKAAESIRVSARRLERLVRDLLDASRIEARRLQLEKRATEVDMLVHDVVGRLSAAISDHPLRVEVHGKLAPVEADPERIEQVLTNLLTNAAKYSPPAMEIRIEVEQGEDEAIVSVSDKGSGIPVEEMSSLFTRFYRTRSAVQGQAPGLGLGLYIARGLIEAHGGRIWATSKMGEGTTFSFALPRLSGSQVKG